MVEIGLQMMRSTNDEGQDDHKKFTNGKIYVNEHLPRIFQEQRKKLIELFKQARSQQKSISWKIVDCE